MALNGEAGFQHDLLRDSWHLPVVRDLVDRPRQRFGQLTETMQRNP